MKSSNVNGSIMKQYSAWFLLEAMIFFKKNSKAFTAIQLVTNELVKKSFDGRKN